MDKRISILGCGWLGLPLAKKLIANGWVVKGSTTKSAKLETLANIGVVPFLVQLYGPHSLIDPLFLDVDILFFNVPPGRNNSNQETILGSMAFLIEQIQRSSISQVIFISSTSVYTDVDKVISETDELQTDAFLYQAECLFTEAIGFQTTVIRYSGLFGPGRYPGRFLSGKLNLTNGMSPVNLIHLDDCIGIVEALLDQRLFGGLYNACAPTHPNRKQFYTLAATCANLPLPDFSHSLQKGKIINPIKIINALNYQFKHGDLMKWLLEFQAEDEGSQID